MSTEYLGFNFIEYLRRHLLLGRLSPPSSGSNEPIIEGLLVPVETALAEISYWPGQDVTRGEFLRYLRSNNIFIGDLEDFKALKQKAKEQGLRITSDTNSKLIDIADNLHVSASRIDGSKLVGRTGYIQDDGSIYVESRSKRHLSGIKRKLGFLDQTGNGFQLNRTPTAMEAEAIRGVLGLKKRPSSNLTQKEGVPTEKMPS